MVINVSKEAVDSIDEKLILVIIIGALEAVKLKGITIDESECVIFSSWMENWLAAGKCRADICDIIVEGCLLSLLPGDLDEFIDELKQRALDILKTYPEYKSKYWIGKNV